jgi:uncharacterized protein YbaP (TraB family)
MVRRLFVCLSVLAALPATPVAAQAPAKHFLWSVTAAGAPSSYLMGSLHVLTPEYYPLHDTIQQAFNASRVLIEEADLEEVSNPATLVGLMSKAVINDGRTLDQVIAPELHTQVMQRVDKAGLPRAAVERMKPWLVALVLTAPVLQAAGFKAEHGIDRHFYDRAKKAGMETRALETVAFQFDRMDQMSAAEQEALLRSSIEELDAQTTNVKSMADAWAKGDTSVIEKLLLPTMKTSPELYKRMLVDRNASWVAAVDRCISEKTPCFVVVGAAHLVGPDSLVAMLRKKGYKVEQQ